MSVLSNWRSRRAGRAALLRAAQARLAREERGLAWARRGKRKSVRAREGRVALLRKLVARRRRQVTEADRVIRRHAPQSVRLRAYAVAASQVGVRESGGNNRGTRVTEYIRSNGGTGPEPWCGDFLAYCFRKAGSRRVSRPWAAVRLLRGLPGISPTSSPQKGDLVRFNFSHVGMFVRDLGGGTIETIEGNTGSSGAVSDSRTGGDGVYRKRRSKSLVDDYLRVTG